MGINFKAFVYSKRNQCNSVKTCGKIKIHSIHVEKQVICTTLDWYLKYLKNYDKFKVLPTASNSYYLRDLCLNPHME